MPCPFTPPFPTPHKSKSSLFKRFFRGWKSWLHVLFERSYSMHTGRVKLPKLTFYVINQPELVERVLNSEQPDFPKQQLMGELLRPLLGDSIFTTNGDVWRRQREMMNGAFTHTRLKKTFPLMNDAVLGAVERIGAVADSGNNWEVEEETTHVAADVIFRTILSQPLAADEAKRIFSAFNAFQATAMHTMILAGYGLPTFLKRRKSERSAKDIRDILAPIIKKRHDAYLTDPDHAKHDDILDSLMRARDADGVAFAYDELVDHVSMLFLAGHETSASALAWAFYLIASCPDAQTRMREEIDRVTQGDAICFEHMRSLHFTRNVFRETLRLYPPVGFFLREAACPATFRDKHIQPHDGVMVSPWLMHRNPREWSDPHVFRPDRFDQDGIKERVRDSYIPFGSGARICIGAGFAGQEGTLVLANIVKNYILAPVAGHVPEPVGRVTVRPENGIKLIVKRR